MHEMSKKALWAEVIRLRKECAKRRLAVRELESKLAASEAENEALKWSFETLKETKK